MVEDKREAGVERQTGRRTEGKERQNKERNNMVPEISRAWQVLDIRGDTNILKLVVKLVKKNVKS